MIYMLKAQWAIKEESSCFDGKGFFAIKVFDSFFFVCLSHQTIFQTKMKNGAKHDGRKFIFKENEKLQSTQSSWRTLDINLRRLKLWGSRPSLLFALWKSHESSISARVFINLGLGGCFTRLFFLHAAILKIFVFHRSISYHIRCDWNSSFFVKNSFVSILIAMYVWGSCWT